MKDLERENCRIPIWGDIYSALLSFPEIASLLHVPLTLHPRRWFHVSSDTFY